MISCLFLLRYIKLLQVMAVNLVKPGSEPRGYTKVNTVFYSV